MPDSRHKVASMTNTSVYTACDSDVETVQGSSEASVDIITDRDIHGYTNVRTASPRKPLPAQWLPLLNSATSTTIQKAKAHDGTKGSLSGSPVERKTVRGTRSSINLGSAQSNKSSFLTKEALDAVNANFTSPIPCRSLSKDQRSPTKVPWNSPTVSPKVGSPRPNTVSPTKPSPTWTTRLGTHVTGDHRRAPSSIISTGATSFHTAHGSPVRSPAISQSSFSSAEEVSPTSHRYYLDIVANGNTV
jgi:hypothetical protein